MKGFQTGAEALSAMQDAFVRQLPVTDAEGVFLGMVIEDQLLELEDTDVMLEGIVQRKESLHPDTHFFDILKQMVVSKMQVLPVVDEKQLLTGCISCESMITHLAGQSSVAEPGGIIVLELKAINYSLAEISRIVESNSAVILHSYVTPLPDTEKILVTIKVNKIDLKEVVATFERFEYDIVAVFHVSDYEEGLRERYESLMLYLNV
jgi:CBS domain-containing protein